MCFVQDQLIQSFKQKADIKVAKSILKVPTAKEVAEYAYQELMKGQTLIVPGLS